MDLLKFSFNAPPRVIAEWGAAISGGAVAREATALGARRPLIVTGRSLRNNGRLDALLASLAQGGMEARTHEGVPPEPSLDDLQACMDAAHGADALIAMGGGSALDVGKGAAALAHTGRTARDFFEAREAVPETGGLPIIAVPTTAGTGSEATWVGVFTDPDIKRKASIRGGAMMPRVVILDAELTVSCPPSVTAYSGMDAFVQALEAYTSNGANPLTDALSLEAAKLTGMNLQDAVRSGNDRQAREAMLLGSFMAGMALNTSRLGLVHGLAHPVGAITGAAHGLICGLLLPPVLRFNRDAALPKYVALAEQLGLVAPQTHAREAPAAVDALIEWAEDLLARIGIPATLSAIGLAERDLLTVSREAMSGGSTKANPRPVAEGDARAVAASCL